MLQYVSKSAITSSTLRGTEDARVAFAAAETADMLPLVKYSENKDSTNPANSAEDAKTKGEEE